MNSVNINDKSFMNTNEYKKFMNDNPSKGYLKLRAYSASEAIPISGVKVVISKIIDNKRVIFYEGLTNSSGLIDKVSLPAPKLVKDNMDVPNKTTYDIAATYKNMNKVYKVNIYDGVCVVQSINIGPSMEDM